MEIKKDRVFESSFLLAFDSQKITEKKYNNMDSINKRTTGFSPICYNFLEKRIDLNDIIIKHPSATFFFRAEGESKENCDIKSGDILVVDRAIEPYNNAIVIVSENDEFKIKRYRKYKKKIYFLDIGSDDKSDGESNFNKEIEIWGVVIAIIRLLRNL